jgi:chaperonin cofactor prefoldin
VYLVIAYYLKHRAEVETYLQEREKIVEEVRQLHESRFDPVGIRERLVLRQQTLSRQSRRHQRGL